MLISINQDEDHCQLFSATETSVANFTQRGRFLLNCKFIAMRAEFQIPLSLIIAEQLISRSETVSC